MITTGMLTTLMVIDIALLLYAWLDSENRNYTHVWSAATATLLSFLLGIYLMTGMVQEPVGTTWPVVADRAFGWFFVMVGVFALVYAFLAGVEALQDAASRRDSGSGSEGEY